MEIVTRYYYNNKGEITKTTHRHGTLAITETFQYDKRGRLKTQTNSSGASATFSYGKRKVTTTKNGKSYVKTYDAWGNLLTSTDPVSGVSYKYSSIGKPRAIIPEGSTLLMDYDEAGNQQTLTDPNSGIIKYTYDAAGRLKTKVDAKGNHFEIFYDALGRVDYSKQAGERTEYDYGTSGYNQNLLTKIRTGNNYIAYNYDRYGRVQNEKRQVNGSGLLNFSYSYNNNGLLQTTTYPGNVKEVRTYDASGNLEKVTAAGQTVWELTGESGTVFYSVGTFYT